jgi:hypothetical protein
MVKCEICESANATVKCSKCGKEVCAKCSVDYFGKPICTACGAPLIGFFGNMHGDPKTSVDKSK